MSSKCFTTGQNYCQPFVLLLSRMFTYELRVSPGVIHAIIPLFHWFCSCFLVVHVFYQCDIRILVFSHEKRKLFLLDSVLWSCEILVGFLWKSYGTLVDFLWISCGCSRIAVRYYRPPAPTKKPVWNPEVDRGGTCKPLRHNASQWLVPITINYRKLFQKWSQWKLEYSPSDPVGFLMNT